MAGRVPNIQRATARLNEIADKGARMATSRILPAFGLAFIANAKELLSQEGHGETYTRKTVKHRASAPGEPPAPDRGRLRNSVAMEWKDARTLRLGSNVEYAPWLEVGTDRIAPRPFFRPAMQTTREQFKARGLPGVVGATNGLLAGTTLTAGG